MSYQIDTEQIDTELSKTLGKGHLTAEGALLDSELSTRLLNYKRTVASRYESGTEKDIPTLCPKGELFVSKKIDGQTWFAVLAGKESYLVNPKGRVLYGDVPVVRELADLSAAAKTFGIVAGELFAIGSERNRPRCGDVASCLGGGENAKVDALRFAAFDVVDRGTLVSESPAGEFVEYEVYLEALQSLLGGGQCVSVVETSVLAGHDKLQEKYKEWVSEGGEEGIVVRAPRQRTLKFKPEVYVDAVVIGYTIRREDPSQCSSVLLALVREDGSLQEFGSCGNLGDEAFRRDLLAKLCLLDTESAYRRASSSGALYRFVRPEHIVEIRGSDLQSENGSGDPVMRMALNFDASQGYRRLRKMPIASILHPVFSRMREDKLVDSVDLRLSQLREHVAIAEEATAAKEVTRAKSTVLRREAYSKVSKGKTMVRKLLVWQTNKAGAGSPFAAFVVHFTDYSSGRKEPLQREVRFAISESSAMEIGEELLAKNIKKGWEKVEAK